MNPRTHRLPLAALLLALVQTAQAVVTANDDDIVLPINTPISFDVRQNDTSSLGSETTLSLGEYGQPSHGTLELNQNDNQFTYTPNEGFEGVDSFQYQVYDDEDAPASTATVTLTVGAYDPAPEPEEGSLESRVQGERNIRTARMLDSVCARSTAGGGEGEGLSAALNQRCGELLTAASRNPAQVNGLVAEIAPDEILLMRSLSAGMIRNHTQRLYQFQDGLQSAQSSGQVAFNQPRFLLGYRGGSAGEATSPVGIFGSINADQAEHDPTAYESGYDYDAYGFTLGVDYRLRPDLHLGLAFNNVTYDLTYASQGGALDADLNTLTGYLSWFAGPVSLDAQLGYSRGDFTTERNLTSFSTIATGDTTSDQYNLSLQADYTWNQGALTARPFLRLDYVSARIDAYDETGGAGWGMGIAEQTLDQVSTSAGVDTHFAISFDGGVLVPGVKLSAVNDASRDYAPVAFHLLDAAGGDGEFSLRPDGEDSLYYQVELGTVMQLKNGLGTFLSVQDTLGYSDMDAWQITGGVHLEL